MLNTNILYLMIIIDGAAASSSGVQGAAVWRRSQGSEELGLSSSLKPNVSIFFVVIYCNLNNS